MALFTRYSAVHRITHYFRPVILSPAGTDYLTCTIKRRLSSDAPSEFTGPNAYEILGVSETSSFSEIKSSFRKLAKETHPDLAQSQPDSSASKRFIEILAAYEVRFWLFEPRCGMHDIGGWYVETFGRDKKGRTVPSQRYWDGLDVNDHSDKKLHPAMYLFALAYRTLDIEEARHRRRSMKDMVEDKMLKIFNWCKARVLRV
ncbi:unnamed protein product [Cuscuta epithymum]|uniref:J domain-containing protein n=1 Tax=Cuscuta epithymum TaxID=186058 RepID=A0AAV0FTG8_9ASTE|nr:unnamed protein product [Cuscuta epithymum]